MEWLLDAWTIPEGVRLCITDGERPRYVDARQLVTFYVDTAHPRRLERLLSDAEGVMVERGTVTTLFGDERDVLANPEQTAMDAADHRFASRASTAATAGATSPRRRRSLLSLRPGGA